VTWSISIREYGKPSGVHAYYEQEDLMKAKKGGKGMINHGPGGPKPGYPTKTEGVAKTVPSPNYPRKNFKGK
jgi:hypothetical protein